MESSLAPAPAQAPIISVSDMITNVAAKTGIEATPVVPTPSVQIVRDAPVMPLAEAGAGEAVPVVEAPAVEAAPIAEPSGEIVVDDGEITLTAQRNADGTFKTKLDPNEKVDFTIKDKATGEVKTYSKSLPELARMAKDAIGMQQTVQAAKAIQPEVEYYRAEVPKWQQHVTSLQEQLEAQQALNRELLSAEDEIVIQRREQYKEEMSPAKQLERIRAEQKAQTDAAQRTAKQQQHAKIAQSFMQSRIAPALAAAESAGLSPYTVTGLVTTITNDLVVNGVIPPANWPEMERRINAPDGPFQREVTAEAAKRTQESATVKAAREAAEAAQRSAQAVVNEQGRQMAPIGRSQGGEPQNSQSQKPQTVRNVLDKITQRPVPA